MLVPGGEKIEAEPSNDEDDEDDDEKDENSVTEDEQTELELLSETLGLTRSDKH